MEINTTLSAAEQAKTKMTVDTFNKTLAVNGRTASQELGKDDFLKLLLTQLSNQDPTSPMENTEFIAQMAQFSSLEQMTNMSTEFAKLANMLNSNEAVSLLGKNVTISTGDTSVNGVVEAVTRGEDPQVEVNGMLYSMDQIKSVYGD
ncbi:MAG: flagellar hook assembly protein FlgD [Candidatus Treponema excrementipullorum]|nr:flagellar hook assembly protein FlgD [Spirochaetia bacterium]MDY2755175.1 flagellar hook assembly protein FlgD [Candidatus Treponema excrementipullorum]MCI6954203.1 flagellar hook assembly protein FlgD [Spirochaetia bacterium]MCI7588263.1 flagellar hook assembly protein FlgD [Spirochaetia bacterium]MDY4465055.1 flagellar hook assembly protein FlgD [Candidatus Treponema excrementipullorum]